MSNEPMHGDRGWHVVEVDGVLRLASTFARDVIWPLSEPLVSECRCDHYEGLTGYLSLHDKTHSCGIVALKHGIRTVEGIIKGEVALWGKVLEFQKGFRAEFAYPTMLYSNRSHCLHCATSAYDLGIDGYNLKHIPLAESIEVMIRPLADEMMGAVCKDHMYSFDSRCYFLDMDFVLKSLARVYNIPIVDFPEGEKFDE